MQRIALQQRLVAETMHKRDRWFSARPAQHRHAATLRAQIDSDQAARIARVCRFGHQRR
jgi:hypothetical protein